MSLSLFLVVYVSLLVKSAVETAEIQSLKTKTAKNVLFLSFRNLGIQAIAIAGFFVLTLILDTGDVGLFALVAESVGILGYFSDVGLASALIQQKDEVTTDELRTTFTIQQLLVVLSLIAVTIVYSGFSRHRQYGQKELWIALSLCFSFVAASLKTIPSVILERHLNFKLVSIIDILENISFYLIAVIFALLNFGAYSYAIATFFRSLLGLVIIYHYSPWPIGFAFSFPSAKKLFRFGIPFQLNSFIAMAKDKLSNVFVGGIIGRESFGLLSWAQKGPRIPLSLMDAIMKVTFPTFSRLQDHPDILRQSLRRSLYFIAFFVFPALAGISLTATDFIHLVPKYTKWLPAVVPLYFYALNAALAAVTTPITNAFNAVGQIRLTTKLMIMWTILTWIFYPLFSRQFGYLGTAAATLLVGLSSFVVWHLSSKVFQVNVLSAIFHPLVSTIVMTVLLLLSFSSPLPLKIIIGILSYSLYHLLFSRREINWFYLQVKPLLRR